MSNAVKRSAEATARRQFKNGGGLIRNRIQELRLVMASELTPGAGRHEMEVPEPVAQCPTDDTMHEKRPGTRLGQVDHRGYGPGVSLDLSAPESPGDTVRSEKVSTGMCEIGA